jgi:hypothetical protein|tara:strand:+ start:698 stop:910 length:213 start_codon:yes stop_codon:yes gene_type:complete
MIRIVYNTPSDSDSYIEGIIKDESLEVQPEVPTTFKSKILLNEDEKSLPLTETKIQEMEAIIAEIDSFDT